MGILAKHYTKTLIKKVGKIKLLLIWIKSIFKRKVKTTSSYEGGIKKDIDKLTDPDWDC